MSPIEIARSRRLSAARRCAPLAVSALLFFPIGCGGGAAPGTGGGSSTSASTSDGVTTGSGGATSSSSTASGSGGATSSSSASGSGGATSSTGSGDGCEVTGSGGGTTTGGGVLGWANWPMPNPVASDLPNPASYDISTAGVVLDKVTGLLWQRAVDPGKYTRDQAIEYCDDLTLAGYSDWRLPKRIELVSLVDYTATKPKIDKTAFPGTPSASFWTSSPVAGDPTRGRSVGFDYGDTNFGIVNLANRVRCVR